MISANTAKRYYIAITSLFKKYQFNRLDQIDGEDIKAELSKLKNKNDLSAAKNGLKFLHEYDSNFDIPEESFFKKLNYMKPERRSSNNHDIELGRIQRTINQISDKKLKLAYRLALISGLRVSELAALEKRDIEITDAGISIHVREGKGGKERTVSARADPYVSRELTKYMEDKQPDAKLFYSYETMGKKARKLNFECHDLRRVHAQLLQQDLKAEGKTADEALEEVKEQLGHTRLDTTRRYLNKRKIAD